MKWWPLLLICLLSASSNLIAEDSSDYQIPLVLRFEKSHRSGIRQIAITFYQDKVEMTLNSNQFCPATDPVYLGYFKGKANQKSADYAELLRKFEQSSLPEDNEVVSAPHSIKVYLGDKRLILDKSQDMQLKDMLDYYCYNVASMDAIDGVELSIKIDQSELFLHTKKLKGKTETGHLREPLRDSGCHVMELVDQEGDQVICNISNFGHAYLISDSLEE